MHIPKQSILLAALSLMFFVMLPLGAYAQQNNTCPNPDSSMVSEWDTVKVGEAVKFEIQQPNGKLDAGEFVWEVTNGTIVSGQRSNQILVSTSPRALDAAKAMEDSIPVIGRPGAFILRSRYPSVPLKVSAVSVEKSECRYKGLFREIAIGIDFLVINRPANVTDVALTPTSDPMIVDVSAAAFDLDDDPLVYLYTISGGKIISVGAKVKWDLNGVKSGTYEIKVGVDDGCGECGKTMTKTFTVKNE